MEAGKLVFSAAAYPRPGRIGEMNMFYNRQMNQEAAGKKQFNTRKASTAVKIIAAAVVLLLLAGNSYYTIQEEEQAVVCTFGSPKAVTTPGLHFKIPFIQNVTKVNTTIKGFTIGYSMDAENKTSEDDAMMITSDYNFINVDFPEPLSPTTKTNSPGSIFRLTSFSAGIPAEYDLLTFSSFIIYAS